MVGGRVAPAESVDGMRQPRIQMDPPTDLAVYDCMSWVVNKELLFDDPRPGNPPPTALAGAEYCGVEAPTGEVVAHLNQVTVLKPVMTPVGISSL